MDGNNCKFNLSVECRDLQNSAYFRFAITPEITAVPAPISFPLPLKF